MLKLFSASNYQYYKNICDFIETVVVYNVNY